MKFKPANIYLGIPSLHRCPISPKDYAEFPPITNLKSIIVQYPAQPASLWQRDLSANIISSSSRTLEDLEFDWMGGEKLLDFPALGGTVFPKLAKLKVTRYFDPDNGAVQRIGHAIVASFPNLEYLVINCDYLAIFSVAGQLPNFPRSLNVLKVTGNFDTAKLACLSTIPATLRTLFLGDGDTELEIDDRVDDVPTILYELLNQQSATLEELQVSIELLNEERILEWTFPVFPALRKLCIPNCEIFSRILFETGPGSGNFGPINYAIGFPVLQVLKINTHSGNSARVRSFIPPKVPRQVVESVREADIRIFDHAITQDAHVVKQARIYARLLALFPNSRDSVIERLEVILQI